MTRAHRSQASGGGFTLIELLVVITIITMLIAILLPALKHAKTTAKQLREMAAANQMQTACATYGNDMKERVQIGYLVWDWAHPGPLAMLPPDDLGRRMEGTAVKRWMWHLAPHFNYDMRAIHHDAKLYNDIRALPRSSPNAGPGVLINPGSEEQEYEASYHTSFGMNATFVGGHWGRGAFRRVNLRRFGQFYITKQSDSVFPSRLMVFGSARAESSFGSVTGTRPGYHEIVSPYNVTAQSFGWLPSDTATTFSGTRAAGFTLGQWNPTRPPADYGHLDFRWFKKAVASHLDGHVENIDVRQAADMRRWSDQATGADWRPVPRP